MTENRIAEIEKDIEEVRALLNQATRTANRLALNAHLAKLQGELEKLNATRTAQEQLQVKTAALKLNGFTKTIDTYGWDQSEKFVKIYVTTLKGLDKLDATNDVTCNFGDRSFDLVVRNLNNTNYTLSIVNLFKNVNPKESSYKVRPDMITVLLRKTSGETWSHLLEKDASIAKKREEALKPDINPEADPQDGLMKMMKKMYEEGDDEMKRTISKAFVEGREKQGAAAPPGADFL